MIPNCFQFPYIGIIGSCDETSYSGLYLNDLDIMTFTLFSAIAKDENIKGETEIRRQERGAIIEVINDFKLLIQKDIQLADIKNEYNLTGNFGDAEIVDRIGFEVERCFDEYSTIEIENFCFWTNEKKKVKVNIEIDGDLTQIDYTTTANTTNCIPLNISASANLIRVYVNLCGAQAKKIIDCRCDCSCSCNCAYIRAIYEDNDTFKYDKTYTRVRVVCRTNWDSLICNFKKNLALPILYKLAIKTLRTLLFTDNYNQIIQNKQVNAKEALNIYEGVPPEGAVFDVSSEYYKALQPIVISAINYLKNVRRKDIICNSTRVMTHCLN